MPKATNKSDEDWWLDAVKRPMGAYYRISPESMRDMHIELAEVGALCASAFTHAGWDALLGDRATPPPTAIDELPVIAHARGARDQIGRAHVWTTANNAHLVCRLLLDKKKHTIA